MNKINSKGFTLLEIAIALAIISIALVSLIGLFNASIGITDYSEKLTTATFLAQKILTEKELADDFDTGSGEKVDLEGKYEGYSYKTEVRETPLPFLKEVNLTVFFSSVIKEHTLKVTTYFISIDAESVLEEEQQ